MKSIQRVKKTENGKCKVSYFAMVEALEENGVEVAEIIDQFLAEKVQL